MSRLIKASLEDNFTAIFDFIYNQDTFDEVFYDDDDNEYNCSAVSLVETEFYFFNADTDENATIIVDNNEINSVKDIEKIFDKLKDETEGLIKEGYIGDITTDDDILENIYYDIMDAIDSNNKVPYISENGSEWRYLVNQKGDNIVVTVYNQDDETSAYNTYSTDSFSDLSCQDFIEEVQELCYYTAI